MQKSFVICCLAFLLVATSASPLQNLPNRKKIKTLRFLEDYATTSGNIPLVLGDLGLLAHVDFSDHSADASESDDDNTDYGNMVIALYTDQTFFGNVCQGFEDYCSKHLEICIHGNTTNVTFPYFSGSGYPIIPKVFLDYSHWTLKSHAIAGTSCSGNYSGAGYGLLGMGFTDFSLGNFLSKKPSFAIQVSKDLNNGTFAFNIDMKNNAKSSDAVATLTSDNLWHVANLGSITIKDTTIDANAVMIFDLGSDSVGLPLPIYTQVMNKIEASPLVESCQIGGDFRPICGFSGDIRNLPTITLNIGTQEIDIPPLIYVVQTQDTYFYYNTITLKLKILSTNSSQGFLVTPEYENYVILGYPVMSYYYTVFESNSVGGGTISLYTSAEYSSATDMTWLFVVVGIIGLIAIGIIFYFFDRKYRKKVGEHQLLEGEEEVKHKAVRRLH